MRAKDLMSRPAVTCHVNDGLHIAAQAMWDHHCGAVAVTNDENKLVGIVTDRDIAMAAYTRGLPIDAILVNNVMTRHVISAQEEQDIAEVEQMMRAAGVRRIPIIARDGEPVGVVSQVDLARRKAS